MRLLFDCDGVLTNFVQHVLNTASYEFGLTFNRGQVTEEDIFKSLGLTSGQKAQLISRYLNTYEWWTKMPLRDGARDFMRPLTKKHEVLVVSSPWLSCVGWEMARRDLLREAFRMNESQLLPIPGRHKCLVRGDAFIEDRAKNLRPWLKCNEGKLGILVAQPYNAKDTDLLRLDTFEQIEEAINKYEERLT